MDAKIDHSRPLERAGSSSLKALDRVRLTRKLTGPEGDFDKGGTGTIVHVHREGLAYEVEITEPVHAVVTVKAAGIQRLDD